MKKLLIPICIFTAGFFLSGEKSANAQDTVVFNYMSDTIQNWTIPCNVDSVTIQMWGSGGGAGYMNYYYDAWCGGSGAYMEGILSGPTLSGQTLQLYVPRGGGYATSGNNGGVAGWPGGGAGGNDSWYTELGGGGGGYAAVAIGGTYYAVAGAGGGGGSTQYGGTAYAGGGGATTGGNGVSSFGTAGTGGTISAGGSGGTGSYMYGSNGSFLQGGDGQPLSPNGWYGGGGGGGGYYGGGGGGDYGNSGGGGSSYPGTSVTFGGITFNPTNNLQGTMNSNTYGNAVAPGANKTSGVGDGNIAAAGGNGQIRIIIAYNYLRVKATAKTNVSCRNGSDGSAYATAGGGSPAYTYSWSNGASTDTATGLTAGTYTITVMDGIGCTASATVTITQPVALTISSAKQFGFIPCHGDAAGKAAVKANGGSMPYTYSWMPAGGSSDTATGLTAGTYTLTVTDPCNDTAIAMIPVTEPPAILVGASQVGQIQCYSYPTGVAHAVAIGGWGAPYTYTWSNGASTDTAKGLKAVTYTVTVSDSSGCMDSTAITITQPPVLRIKSYTSTDTGNCNGMAWLAVNGGTMPYSYLWSDGTTTDTIMDYCAGTYCATVTDSHGCVNYDCATILSSQGIQNITNASAAIKVYPEPNAGIFSVSGIKNADIVEIYNYMGQQVSHTVNTSGNIMHLDISGMANGIYLLKVLDHNGSLVTEKKIMKVE